MAAIRFRPQLREKNLHGDKGFYGNGSRCFFTSVFMALLLFRDCGRGVPIASSPAVWRAPNIDPPSGACGEPNFWVDLKYREM